jgi:enoyl-CoA hydratase/carnithine racemase
MSVELTRGGRVATIAIPDPERTNAIDAPAAQMADHVHEVAYDDSIRCVVVTGEGDAFSSGLDLAGDTGGGSPAAELEIGLNAAASGLIRIEKPTKAVAAAKRLVYRSHHRTTEETFREEALAQEAMITSDDFAEGVAAFTTDREPEL